MMIAKRKKITRPLYCIVIPFLLLSIVFSNLFSIQVHGESVIVSSPYVWHRSDSYSPDTRSYSFYTKSFVYIGARIDVDSSNRPEQCSWVLIDEFVLDYDQDKLIILDVGASTGSVSYAGEDNGDKITWRNIWLREIPQVGPGDDPVFSSDYPTSFLVQITAIIDEKVPGGSILKTTVRATTSAYATAPDWYKVATAESVIIGGNLNLGGFNVENKVRFDPRSNLEPIPIDENGLNGPSSNTSYWDEFLNDSGWVNVISAKPGDVLQMQISLSSKGVPINDSYLINFKDIIIFLPRGLELVYQDLGNTIVGAPMVTATFRELVPVNCTCTPVLQKKYGCEVGTNITLWALGGWKNMTKACIGDMKPTIKPLADGRTLIILPKPKGAAQIEEGGLKKDHHPVVYTFNVRVNSTGHLETKLAVNAKYVYWGQTKVTKCYTDWQTGERICNDVYYPCLMDASTYIPASASSLIISEETPCIDYEPWYYDFGNVTKCDTKSTTFKIKNNCQGTLSYTVTSPCSWVTLSPNSGSSNGEEDTITVTIDTSELSIGEHTCDITISSNGGNGTFQVKVNVVDNSEDNPPNGNNGGNEDNPTIGSIPSVQIIKPKASYIYLRDKELVKIRRDIPIAIGPINITVNASDTDGSIAMVEFYIDEELKHNVTVAPYYYYWNEKTLGIRTIKVRVYDNDDNIAEDTVDVLIINLRDK